MYCVYVDDINEYNKWLEGGEFACLFHWLHNPLLCRMTLTFLPYLALPEQTRKASTHIAAMLAVK